MFSRQVIHPTSPTHLERFGQKKHHLAGGSLLLKRERPHGDHLTRDFPLPYSILCSGTKSISSLRKAMTQIMNWTQRSPLLTRRNMTARVQNGTAPVTSLIRTHLRLAVLSQVSSPRRQVLPCNPRRCPRHRHQLLLPPRHCPPMEAPPQPLRRIITSHTR